MSRPGKTTPGPWEWDWGESDNLYNAAYLAALREERHAHREGFPVADRFCDFSEAVVQTDNRMYGPNDADARLIAAAPDMLAALKKYEATYVRVQQPPSVMEEAACMKEVSAAIVKAEGRTT